MIRTGRYPKEVSWNVRLPLGLAFYSVASNAYPNSWTTYRSCVACGPGTYELQGLGLYGYGWNGGSFTVFKGSEVL